MQVSRSRTWKPLVVATLLSAVACPWASATDSSWTQWGGPSQDFIVESPELADSWPEDGPKKLWTRDLGEGYSGILSENGRLYTMYRKDGKEIVICMSADGGKTVWEQGYEEAIKPGHVSQFGDGPRATPLISGDHLYTIGVSGQMHCLNKKDGKIAWSHDLWDDYESTFLNHGYSSSPYAYKDKVIVLTGGEGNSMIAFNQKDGKVAWKNNDFMNSYSTPRLIEVDGQAQLLCFMAEGLVSIDPDSGKVYWSYDIKNQWNQNINQPIYNNDDHMLLLSSVNEGSRGLKLKRTGDTCEAKEVWASKRVHFYHVTSVGLGEWVYGSSGSGMGQVSFFSCINRLTGDVAWRIRGLSKASTLFADGKFIILDEDGRLALAKGNEEEFEILSKVKIFDEVAWTVPTLSGTTLYVRDQKTLMALDLS